MSMTPEEAWNSSPFPEIEQEPGVSVLKAEKKPQTIEEAWNSSPFPEMPVPRWNAHGAERTNNRSKVMRRALTEDPYALFPKESVPELAALADETPDLRKKTDILAMKYASAQYFSNLYQLPFESVVSSFDKVAETFFGEKQNNPQQVYLKLRDMAKAEDMPGFWGRRVHDAAIGATTAAKGIFDMGNVFLVRPIAELNTILNQSFYGSLELAARGLGFRNAADWLKNQADVQRNPLHSLADRIEGFSRSRAENAEILAEWRGANANFGEEVISSVTQQLPNLLLTFAFKDLKAGYFAASSLYYGGSTWGSEMEDTRYDANMSASGKIANAALCGIAEAIFEQRFGIGRITGKYFGRTAEKLANEEIKRISDTFFAIGVRTLKSIGIDAAGEGTEEILTGATQRFSNLLFHKDGKTLSTMSLPEIYHEICDPMPLEFSAGAALGGLAGGIGFSERQRVFRSQAQMQNFKADMIGAAKEQLEAIRSKENITPEEAALAEHLETAIEEQNVNGEGGLIDLAMNEIRQRMETLREDAEKDQLTDEELGRKLEKEGMQELKQMDIRDREESARKRETIQRLYEEIRRQFRKDLNVELTDSFSLPEHLRQIAETRGDIEGIYDNGRIYLLADRLEPGRVKKVFLHEAAGHEGLRRMFGDDYNTFLEQMLSEHPEEISKVAARRGIGLDTREGRLTAADEFLAELAENKLDQENAGTGEKGTLWKRILAAFRGWLRKHGWNMAYSDEELKELLRASARALRREGAPNTADRSDGGIRFAMDESGKTLFGVAGQNGLLTAQQIITDKDIRQDQPILTADGSDTWGEITPEMVSSDPSLGLEALPIKLLKGRHDRAHAGFGLAHIYEQHGAELEARGYDLSDYLSAIFSRPNQIYASQRGKNIRLELVNKSKPRTVGVLELRKEDGFYSVVTAFPNDVNSYKFYGKKIWTYEGSAHTKSKQRTQSLEPLSGNQRLQPPLEDRGIQSVSNISSSGEMSSGGNVKLSISPVYTGSAADYDAPSLQYIGTGEGAQVYGWGLYGSSSEKVARWYAETDAERKNRARILLDGKEPDPEWLDKADLSGEPTAFEIENSVLEDVRRRKGSISGTLEYYRIQMNKPTTRRENPEFYRICREWLEKNKNRIQYIPENDDLTGRRNLYRQTFFSGKQENLLDWDKPVTEDQQKKIEKRLKEEGLCVEGDPDRASAEYRELKKRKNAGEEVPEAELDAAYKKASRLHAQRNVTGKTINGDSPSGSMVYENLEEILGDPKAVSEFLSRAGIDGVAYIGGSSGVRNYVAFSDQDIRVDEHIRFSSDPNYEKRVEAISKILFRYTGISYIIEPEEASAILAKGGWRLDPIYDYELLRRSAAEAMSMKRERNLKARKNRERNAVSKKDEWTGLMIKQYGEDFTINAGPKYEEQSRKTPFTGTWMDKRKTEKGRRKSGSISAETAAKFLSEKTGKEISADMVVSHFADLKREALLEDYRMRRRKMSELYEIEDSLEEEERIADGMEPLSTTHREESDYKKQLREKWQHERAKAEQLEIDQWLYENVEEWRRIADILGGINLRHGFLLRPSFRFAGENFTGSFISPAFRRYSEYDPGKRTGKALADYQRVREENLKNASGKHSDELAKEIAAKFGGDELEIEQGLIDFLRDLKRDDLRAMYREAKRQEKEHAHQEDKEAGSSARADAAAEHYKALLELAENDRVNIIQLQSSAAAYARRFLPEEMRGHFLDGVAALSKWKSDISPAYPEGRRKYEMEKLLSDMQTYRVRDRINALLDGTKVRTKNGRPIQPLGEAKELVDQIRAIVKTPVYDVENKLAWLKEKRREALDHLDENKEPAPRQEEADRLTEQIALYDMFGKLELKTKEQNIAALNMLRNLIDGDRTGLLAKLRDKKNELKRLRNLASQEITGENVPHFGRVTEEPEQPWKFTLMNNSLRTIIELVTSRSNKNMDDTVLGGIYRDLERSTQEGTTLDREISERSIAKIDEIFHLDSIFKRGAFWRNVEKTEENTGIFVTRHQRENVDYVDPETGAAEFSIEDRRGCRKGYITVKNARKLLQNIADGKAKLPELSVEFLRQQLSDFDLGIERQYEIFHNQDEDAAFQSFIEKGKAPNGKNMNKEALETNTKLAVLHPPVKEKTERVELSISKAEGANLLMQWEQPDVRARMRWNGWSDESIEQLKKFIGPDMAKLAYWMRDEIAATGKRVDAAAREIYGCGLPQIENYFPSSYSESLGKQMKSDPLLGDSFGGMTVNPNFLIARKFHLSDVDLHRSIFQAFFRHQAEANHFLAYGKTIRDCRSIINDRQVRQSISSRFGTSVYNALADRIDLIANGGRTKCEAAEWLGKLFRYWIPAKIAVNSSSILKQIAGSIAYMNEVPAADFIKGMQESLAGSEGFRRFYEFAKNSDYFKNRFSGGLNSEVMYLMKSTRSGKIEDSFGNAIIDKGTYLTRYADGIAILRAGYSVFRYHYQAALEAGRSHNEAWDHAVEKWMRATDETQQSGYLKDQNYFQSSSVYFKYFTAFLSNPIQIMNLELQTWNSIRYGSGKRKEEAKQKMFRQLVINHVIVPSLMVGITEFLRNGFDFEDYAWEDFLSAWLLGPFEGAFIAGKAFQALYGELAGIALHKKQFGESTFDAFPQFSDSVRGIQKIKKLFAKTKPLEPEDYFNAVQGMGDLVALGGSAPIPFAGAAGGMSSAVMRELKRWYRLILKKEQEKTMEL